VGIFFDGCYLKRKVSADMSVSRQGQTLSQW